MSEFLGFLQYLVLSEYRDRWQKRLDAHKGFPTPDSLKLLSIQMIPKIVWMDVWETWLPPGYGTRVRT